MPLVIDAYNVLHVTGVLPPELAGIDLDGLADLVEATRFGRDETWIVCDGMRPRDGPRRRQRVWFSWSGGAAKADDLIVALVRRSSAPRRMTVVTSDRAVATQVRRRDATVVTSEAFLERIAHELQRGKPRRAQPAIPALNEGAVREWLRQFGIEDSTLESSAAPKAERPKPVTPGPRSLAKPPSAAHFDIDDPLSGLDLAQLLAGTPPPRDEPRVPRRTRRDR